MLLQLRAYETPSFVLCAPLSISVQGLAEFQDELIRLAFHRCIKNLGLVIVRRIAKELTLARQLETRRLDFLLHGRFVDAMKRVGITKARAGLGGVVEHQENS